MSFGDLSRINTNVQALKALGTLQQTNGELSMRQMRLATGNRINRAEDDSAGFSISKKLEARVRGQAQALANVGDAKSMLTVAEGSLSTAMDILQTMKEKTVQAANDSMGSEERAAIRGQLKALKNELGDIFDSTTFNGNNLFTNATTGTDLTFQVNAEAGDSFDVNIGRMSSESLGVEASATAATISAANTAIADDIGLSGVSLSNLSSETYDVRITGVSDSAGQLTLTINGGSEQTVDLTSATNVELETNGGNLTFNGAATLNGTALSDLGFDVGQTIQVAVDDLDLNVKDNASAASALTTIDTAISNVSSELANLGDAQKRLSFKQDNLQTSMTNYESARSRIADADFAKEQMEIVKMQILQQTGTAALAQANAAPQSVLSLF